MGEDETAVVNRLHKALGGRIFCQRTLRIPGTEPVMYRPCKFPVADGEALCARHGGLPIRPRRQRALLARLRRAWRALVR